MGEGGPSQTVGEGRRRAFPPSLIRPEGHLLPKGEGFPSLFENVNSATPGKPYVQNDMRVRSKMDEEPNSLNDTSTNGTIGTAFVE